MHKIIKKQQLSQQVYSMWLEAPDIASAHRAGQFVLLQLDLNYGERIPLTINDSNAKEGWVRITYQTVGRTTQELASMNVGDSVGALLGPLGQASVIQKRGHVLCVGGGIGMAPLLPIIRDFHKNGSRVTVIAGARTKDLVIMQEEVAAYCDELILCTDDGSLGRHARVTEPLEELCQNDKPDEVIAIGPPIMMKFCSELTRRYQVPTQVSLNTIMVDGTGMCGSCRVIVGGELKLVCTDGPEFDGYKVDFDNLMLRLSAYKGKEGRDREEAMVKLGDVKCHSLESFGPQGQNSGANK